MIPAYQKPHLNRNRCAFTLIELIVVISIIGVLISLLIPAIMAARARARLTVCQNNLRQCGVAVLRHEETVGHFPTGGWGKNWVGIPGRGSGMNQPGGWIYNILPFIDRLKVHSLGKGPPNTPDPSANAKRLMIPFETMNCPSRRKASLFANRRQPLYCDPVTRVARNDYAINGGDVMIRISGSAPDTLSIPSSFQWLDTSISTGICYPRSEVRSSQVSDGLSYTYMLAEKHLYTAHYETGEDWGDNESMYSGDERDLIRYTGKEGDVSHQPRNDTEKLGGPQAERPAIFGSPHSDGFNAVLCDGSTRFISYDIEQAVHSRLGRRNDHQAIELPD